MTGGMMFKGTPGPWKFEEYEDAISEKSVRVVGSNGELVCDSEPYYAHRLDPKNGPLIAAAPDLLAALINAMPLLEETSYGHEYNMAALAIAKALGETK